MEEDAPAKRIFEAEVYSSHRRRQPCLRWKIKEAVLPIIVTDWRFEGCLKAGRNPLIWLIIASKVNKQVTDRILVFFPFESLRAFILRFFK